MSERRLVSFDWAIKRVLRSKANFEILEGFLSELLKEDVKIVAILESESNRETKFQKQNRLDVKVKNSKDELVIVEIQFENEHDFLQRILFATSKAITENLEAGHPYSNVVKVYSVNILYFDFGHGDDYIYYGKTIFKGLHNHDELQLNERQKELFKKELPQQIFPEYYLIKVNNFDDIARNTLDEWIYFLKNQKVKSEFCAKGLKKANEELDILKLSDEERRAYERYSDDLHYQASMVQSSYGVGKLEGRKEGEEKVRKAEEKTREAEEKAREAEEKAREAEEKAREAEENTRKTLLQTARNLLTMKLPLESIAQATGLTLEEIQKLSSEY
ncbi:MAG: Rpn family recombination-promoting nuclease/putative transposase [Candidatus Riflebacteria bacterium]|nr:Rpn family recombination-promoting nuclease/putative transposase [Candidatus Riflebacteria bacterium]